MNSDNYGQCIIYVLKNKINSKVYVGQTWNTLKQRLKSGYKGCGKIYRAIKKYNKENFYYEILTVCGIQETANYWESYFIEKFNSMKNGYNIKYGGSNGKPSEATRIKLSNMKKGQIRSEEYCKNISLAKMGDKNPMFGTKHTEEHKDKIRQSVLKNIQGAKLTQIQADEIRVLYINSDKLTVKKIAEMYSVSCPTINRILKNESYKTNDLNISNIKIINRRFLLTYDQVKEIKILLNNGHKASKIAKTFKVSDGTISLIKNNKSWKI